MPPARIYADFGRKVLFYGYSYRWLRPRDNMTVAHYLDRSDPIQQQLLGVSHTGGHGYSSPKAVDVPLHAWLTRASRRGICASVVVKSWFPRWSVGTQSGRSAVEYATTAPRGSSVVTGKQRGTAVIQPVKQQLEQCIEKLNQDELLESDLRQIIVALEASGPRQQDLLYLQASTTSVAGHVLGMSILENGKLSDGPADPAEWPYQTVLDAIKDGWRVIQFPNLALLMDESRAYALGCEFILER